MAAVPYATARDSFLASTDLVGSALSQPLSDLADAWVRDIASQATLGSSKKIALVAVGGYGRRELCPSSDLDLVLLHDGRRDIAGLAERIWYPMWDAGIAIDHAVRKPKDLIKVASKDLRVALGLLDARVIFGDEDIAQPVLENIRRLWATSLAEAFLPELRTQMRERHLQQGDVAFLLEPNLKEAHGGLRDVNVLSSLESCAPTLRELVDFTSLRQASRVLLDVRVELHRLAGKSQERMLLQEQDQIAARLGYDDAEQLCQTVSKAGTQIAWISDEIWRRQAIWQPGSANAELDTAREPTRDDAVQLRAGEVVAASNHDLRSDPALALRIGIIAAEQALPISLETLHRLAERTPMPANPWTKETTDAFVALLAQGRRAIPAFQSLDHAGIISRLLPEWDHVRFYHQRNAYHRFTVDRHLLEAVANAAELNDGSVRPDLLLIGTLLHDIGKGLPGDHTDNGIEIVATLAPRMGFNQHDSAIISKLVAQHLLLADTATRRDLSDPRTIELVAHEVGSVEVLLLLEKLTIADSKATGSSAWGPWKAQLVTQLVTLTRNHLEGRSNPRDEPLLERFASEIEQARVSNGPIIRIEAGRVIVAAPDRPGLLAHVTGTLTLRGLDVLAASVDEIDGIVIDVFDVQAKSSAWPSESELTQSLIQAQRGELDLGSRIAQRAHDYAGQKRTGTAYPIEPSILIDSDAASDASVIEVRAPDEIGLLYTLTSTIYEQGLNILHAKVSTIGSDVVDVFYVTSRSGEKLDEETARVLDQALRVHLSAS